MSEHNILSVNGYMFGVESYSEEYLNIKCIPCTDRDRQYVKHYLDSIAYKAENVMFGGSVKTYSTEFDNTELYRSGIAFIKTTGLLDFKHKLYGLWPTHFSDDGMIDFTFDHISKYDFCPETCPYLSLTELRQAELKNITGINSIHKCMKYNERLYHLAALPKLYKCAQCYHEEIDISVLS